MDVMYQVMDQMMRTIDLAQSASANRSADQKQSKDSGDFETMIRQKQQETRGQSSAKDAKKAPMQTTDDTVSDEQYVLAAALMLPVQPVIDYIEPRMDLAAAPIDVLHPETILEMELPQTVDLMQIDNTAGQEIPILTEQAAGNAPVQEFAEVIINHSTASEDLRPEIDMSDDLPVETPVFGYMDATPVKVSEVVSQPLELESEDAAEELAVRIESLLTDENGTSHVELTLSPASLGKITVDITHSADGALRIALSASTTKALSLLERHTGGLQQLLGSDTRPSVQIEVRSNEETQRQFLNPNDSNGQERQQQQQHQQQQQNQRQEEPRTFDFMQQLRLGLVDLAGVSAR